MDIVRQKLPPDVKAFLREAKRRIKQVSIEHRIPNFVTTDFRLVYSALQALASSELLSGNWFCEWGSALGVVTCLASMAGFDAVGIEIDERLVEASQELADDFGLEVELIHDSFIPSDAEDRLKDPTLEWFTEGASGSLTIAGMRPEEFNVVFVYPWPHEEEAVSRLFEHYAGEDAILMSYQGMGELVLRRYQTSQSP